MAAAAPDLDGLTNPIFADRWGLPPESIYAHRGAAHSLYVAFAAGLVAAAFHKALGAGRLAAGLSVGMAMASHGFLDMLTNSGRPVAYLWPLSSVRLFADWRPLLSSPVGWTHFWSQVFARQRSELWQFIIPMFFVALAIRGARVGYRARFRSMPLHSPAAEEPGSKQIGAPNVPTGHGAGSPGL